MLQTVYQAFNNAVERGQLHTVRRIYEFISVHHDNEFDLCLFKSIEHPLRDGHLELALFILDLSYVEKGEGEICVREIHQSILSVGLLEKVMSHTELECTFDYVLANAILTGKKDVINMMENNRTGVFKNNYQYALGAAATVGDVVSATMIMDKHNHHCLPIKYLSNDGLLDKSREDSDSDNDDDNNEGFIDDWSNIHPDVAHVIVQKIGIDYSSQLCNIIKSHTNQQFVRAAVLLWLPNRDSLNNMTLLECAANQSFQTFKLVHELLGNIRLTPYEAFSIIKVLGSKTNVETIRYIVDLAQASRSEISDRFSSLKYGLEEIINQDPEVFALLFDCGAFPEPESHNSVLNLIDTACATGNMDMIRCIEQRYNNNNDFTKRNYLFVPSFFSMVLAARGNHHHVLNYLFCDEQSSYSQVMIKHPTHFIRVLKRVQHEAFTKGNMKVIRMTAKRINQLLSNSRISIK
ncbi:hypothetical protein SAMD00019534_113550 [Acytostelium subglobosum LB1]|uniref:hypothetical protein n=1 Tax=Acytostelium subglobosum LB1 TaxID=1410327 RepID=UPI0006451A7C|nr:hypothetical protein SAMD00019534_113550 [Acytostelium subglobosum LB1]GAM28179.1 hypothetical protein SAMD00019534_113550 [Acytostelium subglobosum LB1]|eukprot:XP_012748813.1 hypothetical protein SAMD00019534_113550 [Acytostelium subglobosum LB1]